MGDCTPKIIAAGDLVRQGKAAKGAQPGNLKTAQLPCPT